MIRHIREHRTNRVGNAFRMAAQTLLHSHSYLGARCRYIRAKWGGLKAVKAMARVLACLYYRLVTKGQRWVDQGIRGVQPSGSEQRELAVLQRKAHKHGMQLVPTGPERNIMYCTP